MENVSEEARKSHETPPNGRSLYNQTKSTLEMKNLTNDKSKTPAQQRLQELCPNQNQSKKVHNRIEESDSMENLSALAIAPGIDLNRSQGSLHSEGEQMDWEPSLSNVSSQDTANNLLCDVMMIDIEFCEFIVPDTNVFIGSLNCIKDIINKGEGNDNTDSFIL